MTEKSPQERNAFVRQHARSISGTSQKAGSISSDGFMDEEDEEPFSTAASAVIAQGSKTDVGQTRPQGGKFPSELSIQRGLQAPLSPSSQGSSEDRDVVTAAVKSPGSEVGRDYAGMDNFSSPNHATLVHQYAEEDNVNPYTNEPLDKAKHQEDNQYSTEKTAAVGLGGAALGVAASDQYQKHENEKAANITTPLVNKQQEQNLAEFEASNIAAPDVPEHYEQQAAREAAVIAAPDTLSPTFPSDVGSVGGISVNTTSSLGPSTVASEPVESARPNLVGQQRQSEFSVSQLHVPGEYPKASKS